MTTMTNDKYSPPYCRHQELQFQTETFLLGNSPHLEKGKQGKQLNKSKTPRLKQQQRVIIKCHLIQKVCGHSCSPRGANSPRKIHHPDHRNRDTQLEEPWTELLTAGRKSWHVAGSTTALPLGMSCRIPALANGLLNPAPGLSTSSQTYAGSCGEQYE